MSMNQTPSGERVHIGIFGRRNAGKSSLINALTNQQVAIVSDVKGTTTDPVKKAMELLPLGPVLLIDTPGLDDEGELGSRRIDKALQMLRQSDIVLVVLAADAAVDAMEQRLIAEAKERDLPYLVVLNKTDLFSTEAMEQKRTEISAELMVDREKIFCVSAKERKGMHEVKEYMGHMMPETTTQPLIRDLLAPNDLVVLVVPIDSAAPKGRLILPQQQVIRDTIEVGAIPVVTRERELKVTLSSLARKPRLVVTDSQAFAQVAKDTPKDIPLTSFSILMARYKGDLATQISGAAAIEQLQDGDVVLIAEGCTHHRQCDDIGTVKMPRWITEYTGKKIEFVFTSGVEFPQDLSPYAMVVHCGGCTLNPKEMRYRIAHGAKEKVPITNYGVLIAYMHGILPRVTEPLFCEKE